jgi:Cof subfamily protein (haloacid dehalogenase superfamily)
MKAQTILFFDVDHTLYDPIKKEVPPETLKAFKLLKRRKDVLIAIATGRAFYMLDVIACLKPYIDIYITINGQIILYDNVIIHEETMTKAQVNRIKTVLEAFEVVYGYYGKNNQVISEYTPYALKMFEIANMPLPKTLSSNLIEEEVYQMWAFSSDRKTKRIKEALNDFLVVPWLSEGLDILTINKTKKEGVAFTLDYFDLSLDQAICFGDSDNDIEMLSYIPCSVAMGNSKPHIKALAKHVTTDCDKAGIYNALLKLNLIKED